MCIICDLHALYTECLIVTHGGAYLRKPHAWRRFTKKRLIKPGTAHITHVYA